MNRVDLITGFIGLLIIAATAGASDLNPNMSAFQILGQTILGMILIVLSAHALFDEA